MESTIGSRIGIIVGSDVKNRAEFAARIQVTPTYVTKLIDKGAKPSDRIISSICREFHVNEEWLRYGRKPMRANTPSAVAQAISSEYQLCPEASAMVEKFVALDTSLQKAIFDYMCSVVDSMRGKRYEESDEQHDDRLRNELEKQIEKEKEDAGKSEA